MPGVKEIVDGKIKNKKVMVFSKSYCPYCRKAKDVLKTYNLKDDEYEVWEIEDEPNCSEIQAYLKSITGASSVPRVFINGECIGGGDETVAAHKSGKLKKLLK